MSINIGRFVLFSTVQTSAIGWLKQQSHYDVLILTWTVCCNIMTSTFVDESPFQPKKSGYKLRCCSLLKYHGKQKVSKAMLIG